MAKFLGILLVGLQLSQDCEDIVINVLVGNCLWFWQWGMQQLMIFSTETHSMEWVLSQFFHSPLSLSSRDSFVLLHFWHKGGAICISEGIDISPGKLIPACASSSPAFLVMYSAYKLNQQGDRQYTALMYSFSYLEPVCCSMSSSNCPCPCPVLT